MLADANPAALEPGIHPIYLRLLEGPLRRHGVDPAALFARAGVSLDQLEVDESLVPVEALRELVPRAVLQSGSPWLGLELGAAVQAFSHGPLGLAVVASGNVRQALEVACRFVALRAPVLRLVLREGSGGFHLRIEASADLGPARQFVCEALLVMLEHVLQALTARDFAVARYALPWPQPTWSHHYGAFLAGRLRFGARTLELFVPDSLADAPCLSADPQAFAFARAECERRLERGADSRDLQTRVRRILWRSDKQFPDVPALARQLGISARSFHRCLAEAGTTYRSLLDDTRRERAERLLRDTDLPVAAIAERLGYADTSNFSRCFRRWCGTTPRAFRQTAATDDRVRPQPR
jgi:AraC-like DNA-binding protein